MKKTYTLIVAALLTAGSAFGQGLFGSVLLNNYDSGKGIFLNNATTAAPAGTMVQLLGGAPGGSLTPVATAANQTTYTITAGDLNANGPGTGSFFDFGTGFVNGVAENGPAVFTLRAWSGAATYDLALTRGSVSWGPQNTGTHPALPGIPVGTALQIPTALTMTVVPEPSAIVLGVLGAAALLLRRRK